MWRSCWLAVGWFLQRLFRFFGGGGPSLGGVERRPIEREVEQRVGWNPASNSEGEEGFVVREV